MSPLNPGTDHPQWSLSNNLYQYHSATASAVSKQSAVLPFGVYAELLSVSTLLINIHLHLISVSIYFSDLFASCSAITIVCDLIWALCCLTMDLIFRSTTLTLLLILCLYSCLTLTPSSPFKSHYSCPIFFPHVCLSSVSSVLVLLLSLVEFRHYPLRCLAHSMHF